MVGQRDFCRSERRRIEPDGAGPSAALDARGASEHVAIFQQVLAARTRRRPDGATQDSVERGELDTVGFACSELETPGGSLQPGVTGLTNKKTTLFYTPPSFEKLSD